MKDFRISNKGSARLFGNSFLEKLTRTHFLTPVILYFFISGAGIYCGISFIGLNSWKLLYMFPAGMIAFTFVEYLIHRFIFHFRTENSQEEELQYKIHGVHHEFPRDKDRLVMPPLLSIVVAVMFFFLFRLLTGEQVWFYFAGFAAGYSTYLIIHYAVHRFRPPANFLKYLWKHHSLHHYQSTEAAFSVSFPLWDYLFGTMPDHKKGNEENRDKLPDAV